MAKREITVNIMMEKTNTSHTSKIGPPIMPDSVILITMHTGIASNKDIAVAINFCAFSLLNNTKTSQRNTIEMIDILIPTGIIKSLDLIK